MERTDTFFLKDIDLWINHYHEKGYCILREVYDAYTLNEAIAGCQKLVQELANRLVADNKIVHTCDNSAFDVRLIELCKDCPEYMPNLFRSELHKPQFYPLLCHPNVLNAVRQVMNTTVDAIRIFPNYSCRPKTKSAIHDVVWHQDAGLRADGGPSTAPINQRLDAFGIGHVVNCWTPLVEVTRENGAMKFLPGSHHRGILKHILLGSYAGSNEKGEKLPDTISSEEVKKEAQKVPAGTYMTGVFPDLIENNVNDAVDIECGPGDLVLFNNILVHCGGVNSTNKIRWSFDWRFQDASKSTYRDEKGHIISARLDTSNSYDIVATPTEWAKLHFT